MKIIVHTYRASNLLESIKKDIKVGDLKTWEIKVNTEGEILFNHLPDQWSNRALVKPSILDGKLIFTIRWWKDNEPEESIKGYILGRFIEILMVHFRAQFVFLEIK